MLYGGSGNDFLKGGAGADYLVGGSGADLMFGGTGPDRFVFTSTADSTLFNPDKIADFSAAEGDRIDVAAIDANVFAAGDQAFTYIGGAGFGGVAGELQRIAVGAAALAAGDFAL
jgi:serralysin